jgi:hypothetical protein
MKTLRCLTLVVSSLLFVNNALFAQQIPESPLVINLTNVPAPKIKFEKTVHDFGKVTGGDSVKTEFVFTNIGEKTLEIIDVHAPCGCTVPGEWTKKVEPGNTGVIPLQFNTGNYTGETIKTATVTCNDPETSQVTLQLKTDIWRPVEVKPQIAMFQLTSDAPSNSVTVKIINNVSAPLVLSNAESKSPAFGAEIKTIKEGKEFDLIVSTLPPFPTNVTQGQIIVKTSSTNAPEISVTAYATILPSVLVSPSQITLPQSPLIGPVTATVFVRNNGTNKFEILGQEINVKGAEVKMTAYPQGNYFNFSVLFAAGTVINAADNPELTIKTTHPNYSVLKVPIIQPQAEPKKSAAN